MHKGRGNTNATAADGQETLNHPAAGSRALEGARTTASPDFADGKCRHALPSCLVDFTDESKKQNRVMVNLNVRGINRMDYERRKGSRGGGRQRALNSTNLGPYTQGRREGGYEEKRVSSSHSNQNRFSKNRQNYDRYTRANETFSYGRDSDFFFFLSCTSTPIIAHKKKKRGIYSILAKEVVTF